MGKKPRLSDIEIGKILGYKQQRLSNRKTATLINRRHHVVNSYLADKENYGKNKSPGRPNVLTTRDKRSVLRQASNSTLSASEISTLAGVNGHLRAVQRVLEHCPTLSRQKIEHKPPLTPRHKDARLAFAKKHMSWTKEWNKVIFSDEKKFNLDGPDGFHYYWHDLRKEESILSKRQMGGGSVMVWAAIGSKQKSPIVFCTTSMNQVTYKEMMEDQIWKKGKILGPPGWIFQHDNASIHKARSVMEWFSTKKIRLLDWPAKSPDLNIIENLWGSLSRKVYGGGKQYGSTNELKLAIEASWKEISQNEVINLFNSLPNRMFEVITNHGKCTHY